MRARGHSGPALADTRSEIQARAEILATALTASNIPAVRKVFAPDFHGVDIDGEALSVERMVAAVHPGGRTVKLMTMIETAIPIDGAVRLQRTTVVPDRVSKPGHETGWIYVSVDTWKQIDGVWRLQSTRQSSIIHYVDRKVTGRRYAVLHVSPPDADPSLPDMSTGNPKAPVTVIEYGSAACPVCAMVNEKVMPGFFAKYVATGKVRLIFRPMETGNSGVSRIAHGLAECAGPDKYFGVIDAIMRAQPEMDRGGLPEQYVNAGSVLVHIGRDAGMTLEQIDACFSNEALLTSMDRRNEAYIERDGIDGTPTFLVNGRRVDGDLSDAHLLDSAIDPLLK